MLSSEETLDPLTFTPIYFLYKVPEIPYYHLFPNYSVSQEINNAIFKKANYGVSVSKLFQEDGSTFILINGWKMRRKDRGPMSSTLLVSGIKKISQRVVWDQTHLEMEELIKVIRESGGEHLEYMIIVSHRFLEGYRIFPLLINKLLSTFYDVSSLVSGEVARKDPDGLGLMVREIEDIGRLEIRGIGVPKIVEYQSNKRVCSSCGAFFNIKHIDAKNVRRKNQHTVSKSSLKQLS